VRIEHVSALRRECQSALAVGQINQLYPPLIVKVLEDVMRKIEIVFRHYAEGTELRSVLTSVDDRLPWDTLRTREQLADALVADFWPGVLGAGPPGLI
jgi:hypothetical protein